MNKYTDWIRSKAKIIYYLFILDEIWKKLGKDAVVKTIKELMIKKSVDDHFLINRLVVYSESIEDLMFVIEDPKCPLLTRARTSTKAYMSLASECPQDLLHLYQNHDGLNKRNSYYFRMAKSLPDIKWIILREAKAALNASEFAEISSFL